MGSVPRVTVGREPQSEIGPCPGANKDPTEVSCVNHEGRGHVRGGQIQVREAPLDCVVGDPHESAPFGFDPADGDERSVVFGDTERVNGCRSKWRPV